MTIQILIKPISKWIVAETKDPGYSQFKQTYSNTKKILEFELGKLGAIDSSVQLEMFIKPEDLRRDGELLRANHKPYKPGVVLSFTIITRRLRNNQTGEIRNETKTLSYPCDTYNDWQDNVRAIALSLEKLRSVARYGVFKYEDMISRLALPSAEGKISDRDAAFALLSNKTGIPIGEIKSSEVSLKTAYRTAAQNLHPDKNGGITTDDFIKLQDAKRILGI
jgi:hypothetical protein